MMKIGAHDMDEIRTIEGHYGPGIWKDGYYFSPLYVNAHKSIKEALESGKIEGVPFKVIGTGSDIRPEDTYIVERNKGLELLTCSWRNFDSGYFIPAENEHHYDAGECIRIELLIE